MGTREDEAFKSGREHGRNADWFSDWAHDSNPLKGDSSTDRAYDGGYKEGVKDRYEGRGGDSGPSDSGSREQTRENQEREEPGDNYGSYDSSDYSESSSSSSVSSGEGMGFFKWVLIIGGLLALPSIDSYLGRLSYPYFYPQQNQIVSQEYYREPITKKDSLEALADYVSEKSGEDFDFWNPQFKSDSALALHTLATLTADENNNGYVIFARDSIQLYIPDLKGRLTQFNLPKSSTIKDINNFYFNKVKLLEDIPKDEKTNTEDKLKGFYSDATEGYRGEVSDIVKIEPTNLEDKARKETAEIPAGEQEIVPDSFYPTTPRKSEHKEENISNTYESSDPATEISRESLPQESVSEQAVNEPKVEDPLKIYESLNPNSEFSRSTPSNHAPVVIERRDENNNVISQETKYLTRKELEESAVTEIEINYPGTGNRYPISREKYQKFYKKLDKNKDGKLDLEELGRYSYEFNMVTKKYTEGDIENIVKEFLRSIK